MQPAKPNFIINQVHVVICCVSFALCMICYDIVLLDNNNGPSTMTTLDSDAVKKKLDHTQQVWL